jgi:hypothetical protein
MLSIKGSRLAAGARALSRSATKRVTQGNRKTKTSISSTTTASLLRHRGLLQSMFYTTERVIQHKSGKNKEQQRPSLYRADNETENCGVGLVASLKSVPSRKVVEQADEMLVRMSHRGGCGCDPASGDGAGKNRYTNILIYYCDDVNYEY